MAYIITKGKRVWSDEFEFDPSPLYAVEVGPADEDGIRLLDHSMAYDPRYGPEEWQLEEGDDAGPE